MRTPRYPSLYQLNTRVALTALARQLGRPATLDDLPDADLDRLAVLGFDWVWLLSVWQTGAEGRRLSRTNPEWLAEFRHTLPDLTDADIPGSGFAITGYTVHSDLGGDAALDRLRDRLRSRGLRLMLDFVPNHTGPDHPWVAAHPEYFVAGTDADLDREPKNYVRVAGRVLAHGRDPYFPGWPDTLQLDYANPATQDAMAGEMVKIAGQCDGVRCDMAMLVLPDVFERTWGRRPEPFWPMAIGRVHERSPDFTFMAEVYWDREWEMQQQGFDYAYDKRLYDRLRDGLSWNTARPIREHFHAGLDYQDRLARFLENHDEPRAAATFPGGVHEAAAVVTFLTPGLRFFHQGQLEGHRVRISPHLNRGPDEPTDPALAAFYDRLLGVLRRPVVRDGKWQLLECAPAWDGNGTWDGYLAFAWDGPAGEVLLVVVNYAPTQGQCYVRVPLPESATGTWRLRDLLGTAVYDRDAAELRTRGLYVDAPAWQAAVFALGPAGGDISI